MSEIIKLRKKISLFFYNAEYPEAYTPEEITNYEQKVDEIMGYFQDFITAEKEIFEAGFNRGLQEK